MKRFLILAAFLISSIFGFGFDSGFGFDFSSSLSAEDMQIVFPKTIYTGDTVEIRYIFHTDANIFSDTLFEKNSTRLSLSTSYTFFETQKDNFYVKEIFLEKIGSDFTLSLKVVPWKAGYLVIPPFDLTSLVRFSQKMVGNGTQFVVSLKPIEVNSYLQKIKESEPLQSESSSPKFRPQAAPEVMPGTALFLVLSAIFYFFLLSAAIFALLKIPAISKAIGKLNYLLSLKHNSRKTVRKLSRLLKNSDKFSSDKDFAAEIQKILREFLNTRFSRDFNSVSTSALYSEFTELTGGELSPSQDDAVESLIEIFYRTDVVRYAENQNFEAEERSRLISKSLKMIQAFDSDDESDENSDDENNGNAGGAE